MSQTYYLTMDLSHQGMFERTSIIHINPRGGYRAWFNPIFGNPNKNARMRPTNTAMFGDEEDNDGDEEGDGNENDKDDNVNNDTVEPQPKDGSQGAAGPEQSQEQGQEGTQPQASSSKAHAKSVGEIQVLELHSDNPIISYKGRNFSGSWASNIGTEFIFVGNDPMNKTSLPTLRRLDGGVDLLAASSARILTKPGVLKPKVDGGVRGTVINRRTQRSDQFRKLRKESGISVRVDFDKNGTRAPQAKFLETLMAIKRKRGEMDVVTTQTKDTTRNNVDDDPDEIREQEKRRKSRLRHKKRVAKKWEGKGGKYKPKGRVKGWRKATSSNRGTSRADSLLRSGVESGEPLSTPTPASWNQLLGVAHEAKGAEDAEDDANDEAEDDYGTEDDETGDDETGADETGDDETGSDDTDDDSVRDDDEEDGDDSIGEYDEGDNRDTEGDVDMDSQ